MQKRPPQKICVFSNKPFKSIVCSLGFVSQGKSFGSSIRASSILNRYRTVEPSRSEGLCRTNAAPAVRTPKTAQAVEVAAKVFGETAPVVMAQVSNALLIPGTTFDSWLIKLSQISTRMRLEIHFCSLCFQWCPSGRIQLMGKVPS